MPDANICNHTSAGMILRDGEKILLIERRQFPFGFAAPAGHVDEGESFEDAAIRELREEVGLEATNLELVFEGDISNQCKRKNGDWHHWKVFDVSYRGEVKRSLGETKSYIWADQEKIKSLVERSKMFLSDEISQPEWEFNPGLEPVWIDFLSLKSKI